MIPRPLGGRMAKTAMGARGGVWGIIFNLIGIHSYHEVKVWGASFCASRKIELGGRCE